MRITKTRRGLETELHNGTPRVRQTESGVKLDENRFQNDRDSFYATELNFDDLAKIVFTMDDSAFRRLELIVKRRRSKINIENDVECVRRIVK